MCPPPSKPLILLGIVFLLSACPEEPLPPGDAVVELGTGTVDFAPLADGDELPLIAGPQGGYHFIVHVRAMGIAPGDPRTPGVPENPRTTFVAYRGDIQIDLDLPPYRLGFQPDGEYVSFPSGRILQVSTNLIPELYGQDVRITVTVEDEDGDTASDERTIVAIEDPNAEL